MLSITRSTWLFGVLVLAAAIATANAATPPQNHPPIPIAFDLKESGFVTLVIEDAQGRRVRNLIAETRFTAGPHILYWDGMDESLITPDPVTKSIYQVHGKLVGPGEYRIRGLFRKDLHLRYEFTVYNPGNPPWRIADRTGGWLSDHTPQSDVLFLPHGSPYGSRPQMLLGSSVAEDGFCMAWVDLDAKKLYSHTVGRAFALARDVGPHPRNDVHAYCAFLSKGIQVVGLQAEDESLPIVHYVESPYEEVKGGALGEGQKAIAAGLAIAAYDHVVAISLPERNEILFVDAEPAPTTKRSSRKPVGRILGTVAAPHPMGLMADASGRLYVLSDKKLKRFEVDWKAPALKSEAILVSAGLEDPRRLTADEKGNLYVSDWGQSHQVKVFTPEGKFVRAIGKPGEPQLGVYDPNKMSRPQGLAISPDGHLWVAEYTGQPKRLSIWTLDGKLVRGLYGPSNYGGGGTIDPWDRSRLFYSYPGCMEFHLDWEKGQGDLHSVCFRDDPNRLTLRDKEGHAECPERPFHLHGRVYLSNVFHKTIDPLAGIWLLQGDKATLVAAGGALNVGDDFAKFFRANAAALNKRMPAGVTLSVAKEEDSQGSTHGITFTVPAEKGRKPRPVTVLQFWSDLNGDGKPQVEEFSFFKQDVRGHSPNFTLDDKLAFLVSSGVRLAPAGFTPGGVPIYDAAQAVRLTKDFVSTTTLGRQALLGRDGFLVVTGGPMEGYKDGQRFWYYHSQFNGNCKGKSPKPQYPGQLLNTLHLLGPAFTCPDGKTEVWAVQGDYGQVFLLTTDGLFVATLFKDNRTVATPYWPMRAQRGMLLDDVSLREECYESTITQTSDGTVYLQGGKNMTTLIRLDGLESVDRFDAGTLKLTPELVAQAKMYQVNQSLPSSAGRAGSDSPMKMAIRPTAPAVDGKLGDWKDAEWVQIDKRSKAAVCISGDRLYVAYHLDYDYRLENSPDSLENIFKGGPALDVMIGTDPNADPQRKNPAPGDIRLLVTQVNKKTRAAIFRAVVPGTKEPVTYESPIGAATIDQVEDISGKVNLAGGRHADKSDKKKHGIPVILKYTDYEFSVPLSVLGLVGKDGLQIRGDVGLLLGESGATTDRIYWHNKFGSMTSDLPTEARLTPNLWGQWIFKGQ